MSEYRKELINKWSPRLESNVDKDVQIANLLESQIKLNRDFLPESANVTGDIEVYHAYILPLTINPPYNFLSES